MCPLPGRHAERYISVRSYKYNDLVVKSGKSEDDPTSSRYQPTITGSLKKSKTSYESLLSGTLAYCELCNFCGSKSARQRIHGTAVRMVGTAMRGVAAASCMMTSFSLEINRTSRSQPPQPRLLPLHRIASLATDRDRSSMYSQDRP